MNYMMSFMDLKGQRQLHYDPTSQKFIIEGDKEIQGVVTSDQDPIPENLIVCAYKGMVSNFEVSLAQSKFRPRYGGNGDLSLRSQTASLLSVLTKACRSLN